MPKPRPLKKFVEGKFYTITSGRFKGMTAVAWDNLGEIQPDWSGDVLFSWDFPGDGCLSFRGTMSHARKATDREELIWRREHGIPPTELE